MLLRNGFEKLQSLHSRFLEKIGTISMWLFVSQYHILMAFNGNGTLVLIPRYYHVNLFMVLMVFVLITLVVSKHMQTFRRLRTTQSLN